MVKIIDALNEILLRERIKVTFFFWGEWLLTSGTAICHRYSIAAKEVYFI
jgi:hypothetical protein